MVIIYRKKTINRIKKLNKVIIFGRRKTGKTFLAKNHLDHDFYFFVNRDKTSHGN